MSLRDIYSIIKDLLINILAKSLSKSKELAIERFINKN